MFQSLGGPNVYLRHTYVIGMHAWIIQEHEIIFIFVVGSNVLNSYLPEGLFGTVHVIMNILTAHRIIV